MLATVAAVTMLGAGTIDLRWVFGGASEVHAASRAAAMVQPAALPGVESIQSAASIESLPPWLVDSVTGKPVWWSTGILQLPKDALTTGAVKGQRDFLLGGQLGSISADT